MASCVEAGETAVDVGTSAGIMTAVLSRKVGKQGKVYAFEPANRAYAILQQNMAFNGLTNVVAEKAAVSNVKDQITFVEYRYDPNGGCAWQPEASSILASDLEGAENVDRYTVDTVRLDDYFRDRRQPLKLVKIDVEGFEICVVEGALEIVTEDRPYLAIDIHRNPHGPGDTDAPLRAILSKYGYRFERLGHVLTATP
jgi:FkbM family methyltransferase